MHEHVGLMCYRVCSVVCRCWQSCGNKWRTRHHWQANSHKSTTQHMSLY